MFIYQIENTLNNRKYVGQTTKSLKKHFKLHCNCARRGEVRHLYSAMRKYGVENFQISLIEETDNLNEREKYWIEILDTKKNGYNETDGEEGLKGFNHSSETKKKIKDRYTDEVKKEHSKKTKEGMKRWWNDLSEDDKKDYIERCTKKPENYIHHTGHTYTHTEETKKRMSKARIGHVNSEETRKRISQSKKGQLTGDLNPMKREDVREKHRLAVTGRRIAKRADGTRYWVYPKVIG